MNKYLAYKLFLLCKIFLSFMIHAYMFYSLSNSILNVPGHCICAWCPFIVSEVCVGVCVLSFLN